VNFNVDCKPRELLQELVVSRAFPNVIIALRIFVSLPASVASSERTFNVLKQARKYYRSNMEQGC
jgi:hypothetical protein